MKLVPGRKRELHRKYNEASSRTTKLKIIAKVGRGGAVVRNLAERMRRQKGITMWNSGEGRW